MGLMRYTVLMRPSLPATHRSHWNGSGRTMQGDWVQFGCKSITRFQSMWNQCFLLYDSTRTPSSLDLSGVRKDFAFMIFSLIFAANVRSAHVWSSISSKSINWIGDYKISCRRIRRGYFECWIRSLALIIGAKLMIDLYTFVEHLKTSDLSVNIEASL